PGAIGSQAVRRLRPRDKFGQFLKYVRQVYDLPALLHAVPDRRPRPQVPTAAVLGSLIFGAVLRLRSLNALEGALRHRPFQRLLGRRLSEGVKTFSADTIARVLDGLDSEQIRRQLHRVVFTADHNKAFQEGLRAGLRCVAIDGWEPCCSQARSGPACLTRQRGSDASPGRTESYHRLAVALLLGRDADVVLGVEPQLNLAERHRAGEVEATTDEGELTAALRLVHDLHQRYGALIHLFVLDGLYPNGPMMTAITRCGRSAVITLRKDTDEPLKEALALFRNQPPTREWDDLERREHVRAWDIRDLRTLDTFDGPIRVVRCEVSPFGVAAPPHIWCAAVIGPAAAHLTTRAVLDIQRARWHIENTAFHQWTVHYNLARVYRHSPRAVLNVVLLWMLAFNLMQLFVYRRLRRRRHPLDPCHTILHIVAQMRAGLATLRARVLWPAPADTS
ncbi:transposase, partial [Actinokineospora sp.]|uniref:transposase n=1 Tax=Actinokineospora sp. TaxID=1872133 RepID=UPI003D6A2074